MILCDGNYGLGAYGMDSVHNRQPKRSRVTSWYSIITKWQTSMLCSSVIILALFVLQDKLNYCCWPPRFISATKYIVV